MNITAYFKLVKQPFQTHRPDQRLGNDNQSMEGWLGVGSGDGASHPNVLGRQLWVFHLYFAECQMCSWLFVSNTNYAFQITGWADVLSRPWGALVKRYETPGTGHFCRRPQRAEPDRANCEGLSSYLELNFTSYLPTNCKLFHYKKQNTLNIRTFQSREDIFSPSLLFLFFASSLACPFSWAARKHLPG